MRQYTVKLDKTTDGRTCFIASFDDLPDVWCQGLTKIEAVDALMAAESRLPSYADLLREYAPPAPEGTDGNP